MLRKYTLLTICIFCISVHASAQIPIKRFQKITGTWALENKILLNANDGLSGDEMWVSDGTPHGTMLLKDIYPGYSGSNPDGMISFKGKIYFDAYSHQYQSELWSTDGTPEGTSMFADLSPPNDYYGGTSPLHLRVFNDHLYFVSSKNQLYRTNGDPASLTIIDQAARGTTGQLSAVLGKLYYYKGSDILHWTNGTASGEFDLPLDIENTYFKGLYATETQLFANRSSSYDTHIKIYALDHSTNVWAKVFDLKAPVYGSQEITNVTPMGDKLFFTIRKDYDNVDETEELWVTNGTAEGTKMLKSFLWSRHWSESGMENFKVFNHKLYFRSGDGSKRALWQSDGTSEGTLKVHDVVIQRPMNLPNSPAIANERLYFAGSNTEYAEATLWSTDGSAAGTRAEMNLLSNLGGLPYLLTSTGNTVYFVTSKQFEYTLWNNAPAPEININVAETNGHILLGGTLHFYESSEQSCLTRTLQIFNDGKKALALGSIKITGSDFSLEGKLPDVLKPGERTSLRLLFHPLSKGSKTGSLTIASGDDNEGLFTIQLRGSLPAIEESGFCEVFNNQFVRYLEAAADLRTIVLSNNIVTELRPSGTSVGAFSIPESADPALYSLVEGDGDTHNDFFSVEGADLKTNKVFIYGNTNFYTIRVKATLPDQSVREESFTLELANNLSNEQSGACEQQSESLSYGLTDIAVNSEGSIFTITNMGQIQRSDDEGATWSVTNLGYAGPLNDIFFRGTTGYITGDYLMLKSDDNGRTWFSLYLPPSSSYNFNIAAYFLNDNTGYVSSHGGRVLFTNDGGKTWEERRTGSFSGDNLRALFFLDEQKGFALNTYRDVLKTTDGGKTWTEIELGSVGYIEQIHEVVFLNGNEGFLVTSTMLLQTSNGGTTWQKVDLSMGASLRSLKFVDDKKGYLAGPGALLKTLDGGKSWTRNTGVESNMTGFAILNNKIYTTHIGSYNYYSHSGRAMRVTSDEGVTWQQLQKLDDANHHTISFPSPSTGFVCSEYYNFKTEDGGLTWKTVGWNNRMFSAHFFDENTAVFSDNQKLYRSTDGGATITEVMTPVSEPNTDTRPGKLYAATHNLVFSYSWYSLYRSTDAGANWTYIPMNQPFYARDIHFPSENTGYMVELFGAVKKTIDAGLTWTTVYTPDPGTSIVYKTIFFVNDNLGYRGGARFSKTSDGGESWQDIYIGLQREIQELHFTTELHGYAVVDGGKLYETADGGESWKEIYIRDAKIAYGIEFRNDNIYLAGEKGYIARYKGPQIKPLQPGYIFGPQTVCVGDVQIYHLSPNTAGIYSWNAPGAKAHDAHPSLEAHFPEPGEYTLTVAAHNACGVSESRTLLVTAKEIQAPVIIGNEFVAPRAENAYQVQNFDPSLAYYWDVTPEASFSTESSASRILVRWMTSGIEPTVSVIAIDTQTGCRKRGDDLLVSVSLPVGIEETEQDITVYPNPATHELFISSGLPVDYAELYDVDGKLFLRQEISPLENTGIKVSHIPRGVYILRLLQNRKIIATKKLVKR